MEIEKYQGRFRSAGDREGVSARFRLAGAIARTCQGVDDERPEGSIAETPTSS
jgi:hypothetical protein